MSAFKPISTIINAVQAVLATILAGVSIWFFIELKGLTDLRDRDKTLLDYEAHWPLVVPWMYISISVVVICVSLCGVYSLCTNNKSAMFTYVTFLAVITLVAFAAGFVGLTNAATKQETDDFISSTVNEAFTQITFRKDVQEGFQNIEKRFRCCGVDGSSSYTQGNPPESCCDVNELAASCASSASRRNGCKKVAVYNTQMFIKFTSIGSLIIGLICTVSLIVAVLSIVEKRNKSNRLKSMAEQEPLKVPL